MNIPISFDCKELNHLVDCEVTGQQHVDLNALCVVPKPMLVLMIHTLAAISDLDEEKAKNNLN